ncbi:PREDICTED: uncharacterized protein LOC106742727 [Dinoponera quadriceps]|uniref:Uncharacterized protein LOC106742727 n=1 Tax=Dinoponera quadriceps TaxID=609295 RepID=A0A6P3WZA0_DINQU|nr:PREDICTED: uncharacterized protein LOC106742727 [Dinoponera quadriceps]XP_014471419.1 PREDICTED: uncharacterized protein LOC106742727 [Dinoponera quadriceps]
MEFDKLEQCIKSLNEAVSEFPIGAVSLEDYEPIEKKIQVTRESLMRLNARLLMLRAKSKHYTRHEKLRGTEEELGEALQRIISDTLINHGAIKLCLHSATIVSILNNKEGNEEHQKKLCAYMSKLFIVNDNIISIQQSIEEAFETQLNLKVECQKALNDYKNFLKEQKEIQNRKLQETCPDIARNKSRMENTLRKINIMKKLIRNFIAASNFMLTKQPLLLEMLEKHRELLNVETILKMTQDEQNIKHV